MSTYTITTQKIPARVLTPEEIQQQRIRDAVDEAIKQSNSTRQREIENLRNQQRERDQEIERRIANLDKAAQETARNHLQQIQEQSKKFYNKLQQQSAQNRENLANLQQQTAEEIRITNQRIEAVATNQQQQIDSINKEIVGINNRFKSEDEKAQCLRNELLSARTIVEGLQHEKFRQGHLQKILEQVNRLDNLTATSNSDIGRAIIDLNDLAKDIEIARIEYEAIQTNTLEAVDRVLVAMNENRKNTYLTNGENEIIEDEKVDLDFWSEGEYKIIEQKLAELKEKVKNGENNPNFTLDNLKTILIEINDLDKRQIQIVDECCTKNIVSYARKERADDIICRLKRLHYELMEGYGYEDNDKRKSYRIKMKTNNGNKIDILISSKNDDLIVSRHEDCENYESDEIKKIRHEELNQVMSDESSIEGLKTSGTRCFNTEQELRASKLYDQVALRNSIEI